MIEKKKYRIVHLIEAPSAMSVLERWFIDEWTPWYGPDGQGDARADLEACCNNVMLPLCLVALGSNETVLGTAFLKNQSVGDELGVGPWLSALLVKEEWRGQGIGSALIAAIEAQAQTLGFEIIYCSTDSAENLLTSRSWEPYGSSRSLRGPVSIFRCLLGGIDRS